MRNQIFPIRLRGSGGIQVLRRERKKGRWGNNDDGGGDVAVQVRNGLPPELIINILSRLPVREILGFRLVSRAWRRIHEDVLVIRLQRTNASNLRTTGSLILMDEDRRFRKIEYNRSTGNLVSNILIGPSSYRLNGFHRMIGSLNGLILFKWVDGRCVIWNPCIGLFWSIQSPPTPPNLGNQNVNFSFGFAYDSAQDDYLLVTIVHVDGQNSSLFSVYRPITRDPISYAFPDPYQGFMPDGVFLGRYLYWIAVPTTQNNPQTVILRFDIVSYTFNTPYSLRNPTHQEFRHVLGVYDGALCLYRSLSGEYIDIVEWGGLEGGHSWDIYPTIQTHRTDLRRFLPVRMDHHDILRLPDMVLKSCTCGARCG